LLCVASLTPRKGHRVLVAALARIRDLDWEMRCIGSLDRDPRTARSIRQMISAARLGRRITLAGEQPPRMVMRAYRAADLFVLPSLHEGYGMAFAEAMAHGLPIVATAAGAIPETVPREAGLLVPAGDVSALARALRRVIAEPALAVRLAAGARASGGRLPDWRRSAERWEQALDLLAALHPDPRFVDCAV
jgi:glycosyltransferase involved in cell wall biosynthesis